jgi:hypothetical protein
MAPVPTDRREIHAEVMPRSGSLTPTSSGTGRFMQEEVEDQLG